MNETPPTVGIGVAVAGLGGALAVLAFVQPAGLHAPPWVVYAAALAFVVAGWLVVARARDHALLKAWLPVALLACLVAPPLWIAFGGGYRRCGMALAGATVRLFGLRSDLPCRIAFAIAAVVGVALLAAAIRQAVRSMRDPAP